MKKIKNSYKIIIAFVLGICVSVTSVYAVDAYIESKKVSYDNTSSKGSYKNVQESIDELYERSGIHKEKWIDPVLNGADPVLTDPLIPVEIKPNGDVYYANLNSEWYNYSEKRWANAVILNDNKTTNDYKVGEEILNADIKGYFVWIPRYKYKVWNMANTEEYTTALDASSLKNENYNNSPKKLLGNAKIIEIVFESKNASKSTATKVGDYQTHPAFRIENKELSGIWVGKFEVGGTINNMIVKPNETSLRNQTVKAFFENAKNFANSLKSHMLKNTEWGAVAYLSHSEYGIGKEVNINNNSDFKTGYSATSNADQSTSYGVSGTDATLTMPWNTLTGYLASTTGNISGIYDMNGGSFEYVAAYKKNGGTTDKSGFSQEEESVQVNLGYLDEYPTDSGRTLYNKRILGDATGETGPFYVYYDKDSGKQIHNSWYGDGSYMVDSSYGSWFRRGGIYYDGLLGGQFGFSRITGAADIEHSFRLALAP